MAVLDDLKNRKETLWINPEKENVERGFKVEGFGYVYMKAAQNRLMRFLPYIAKAFPETADRKGVIESNLLKIEKMEDYIREINPHFQGNLFLKDDAHLPIAGSVKARGGIHEVLAIAESLAQKAGILHPNDSYGIIDSEEFRNLYGQYTIQVGSTGNLGLSIGRTAAKLGFKVIVHMSSDAKEWKKKLLREEGVIVKEYDGDYGQAVANGRKESMEDDHSFFIDDENSKDLFFGYSTAAMRLKVQLGKINVPVSKSHPLFVYIPCGVGGAPGGITFGLKQMFEDNVHCFFVEPVEAPCMLLGMATDKGNEVCVQDVGLSGNTIADGLAVGRPSEFVCKMMKPLVSGLCSVEDEKLLNYQKKIYDLENIFLEPSACAGFHAVSQMGQPGSTWEEYIEKNELKESMKNATHVVWATGGGLMPEEERFL